LIFHPLPHASGLLAIVPVVLTRLAGETYVIGTLVVFGSLWFALRSERKAATVAPPKTPALAA
jgi:hypothetical protein